MHNILVDLSKVPNGVQARVLVVDDHPSTATTMARAISRLGPGVEALAASNGEEALAVASQKPVDILITDWMMNGINGVELIEKMQTNKGNRSLYTIMISAYEIQDIPRSNPRLMIDTCLRKPVRIEEICRLVARQIQRISPASPLTLPNR